MMERALITFLHGAARRLTGRQPRRGRDGKWNYPSLEGAMKEAGLTEIHKSIQRRQTTVAQYIATRPLLDICVGTRQREGGKGYVKVVGTVRKKETETEATSGSELGTDTEGEEAREAESRASGSSGAEWSGASADEWT